MSIKVQCAGCQKELSLPGALLFSPPDMNSSCVKLHLCVTCFQPIMDTIEGLAREATTPKARKPGKGKLKV